jgi:hypothetical protein
MPNDPIDAQKGAQDEDNRNKRCQQAEKCHAPGSLAVDQPDQAHPHNKQQDKRAEQQSEVCLFRIFSQISTQAFAPSARRMRLRNVNFCFSGGRISSTACPPIFNHFTYTDDVKCVNISNLVTIDRLRSVRLETVISIILQTNQPLQNASS